jgi:hypothetical protein
MRALPWQSAPVDENLGGAAPEFLCQLAGDAVVTGNDDFSPSSSFGEAHEITHHPPCTPLSLNECAPLEQITLGPRIAGVCSTLAWR